MFDKMTLGSWAAAGLAIAIAPTWVVVSIVFGAGVMTRKQYLPKFMH